MRNRQLVFLGITMASLLLMLFTSNIGYSVIPGWHTIIVQSLLWPSFSLALFLVLVSVVYGLLPEQFVPNWLFWLHATGSIVPIAFQSLYKHLVYGEFSLTTINNWQEILFIDIAADLLFFLNQLVFVLFLFYRQLRTKKAAAPATTPPVA